MNNGDNNVSLSINNDVKKFTRLTKVKDQLAFRNELVIENICYVKELIGASYLLPLKKFDSFQVLCQKLKLKFCLLFALQD